MKRTKAKELIKALHRLNLDQSDYDVLCKRVKLLIHGNIPQPLYTFTTGHVLYRGCSYLTSDPTSLRQLMAPPKEKITSFQRCNGPGDPRFYCSLHLSTPIHELNCRSGSIVYVSRWISKPKMSLAFLMDEPTNHPHLPSTDLIWAFMDGKFRQRIHQDLSNDYKITAAICKTLLSGALDINKTNKAQIDSLTQWRENEGFGGILYPSVAAGEGHANIAMTPNFVEDNLTFDGVEKIEVLEIWKSSLRIRKLGSAQSDADGDTLNWIDKPISWEMSNPGEQITFTGEGDWVPRRIDGSVLPAKK